MTLSLLLLLLLLLLGQEDVFNPNSDIQVCRVSRGQPFNASTKLPILHLSSTKGCVQ